VGRYDGTLGATPSPDVLLAPLTTREAVLSSSIEGTQVTMGEVLEYEAGRRPGSHVRREDIQEVKNYRSAMRHAENMLTELLLSMRVIGGAHRVLLNGGGGERKAPGKYRRVPNWIGPPGCAIDQARFVPVGADKLPEAMGAWERNIHCDASDPLAQLAILDGEFEALHPFLDGNGRLGRMLVPLFVWQSGLISAYFEARRDAYSDGLLAVSRDDDWTGWCRFFLEAVQVQAEDNLSKAQGIIDLYDRMKERMTELTRSRYAIRALD
jgi:Fic family protein